MEAIRIKNSTSLKPESASGAVKITTVSPRGFAANDPAVHQGCSGCSYDVASARLFYLKDRIGSIRAITDEQGSIVESYSYNAFGIMTITNSSGAVISESNYGNTYTYTGRRFDAETGLYYYRNRMYSPSLGRFLSEDPVGYEDGYNLYQYAHNNPLKYVDPLGTTARSTLYPGGADYPVANAVRPIETSHTVNITYSTIVPDSYNSTHTITTGELPACCSVPNTSFSSNKEIKQSIDIFGFPIHRVEELNIKSTTEYFSNGSCSADISCSPINTKENDADKINANLIKIKELIDLGTSKKKKKKR